MEKFVDVILPLPLHSSFTYSLPEEMAGDVQIGCRVIVPFGRKKYYTAIVRNIHYSAPTEYEVKEVSALLDAHPILLPAQFKFWEWLADYYQGGSSFGIEVGKRNNGGIQSRLRAGCAIVG